MELSQFDKSRTRYHLGYFTVSVPAGDYARLEEAMNTIPDSFFYDKIILHLDRCDRAEKKTFLYDDDPPNTRLETIRGDVDRTIRSTSTLEALKTSQAVYLEETNRLAYILYVPNYKDPLQARYRYERSGAEFIQALPGPADTAVGTRIMLAREWK